MKIRMLHQAGDYGAGETVEVSDRQGRGLITSGYAAAVEASSTGEQAMEQTQPSGKGRLGKGREVRG